MALAGKPRLLVLSSTYPRWAGDSEPGFVHELCRRLADRFDVVVLCPHAPGAAATESMDGVAIRRFRYAPASLETLVNDGGIAGNLKRARWKWLLVPLFCAALLLATARLARRWRPQVIHGHWLIPQGVVAAMVTMMGRTTPPFVITSHGADLFAFRGGPFMAIKRFVARRAAALTVVSQAMCEELTRLGADAGKVTVRSMGVDLVERFTPRSDVVRSADEILFVGRMVEKKGLRHLIDALPRVLQLRPEAHLTVAGFGPEEAERRQQVQALGLGESVTFLGAVAQDELPMLYRRAAVFVAPFVQAVSGDQEGLGLVTVEAIGCGCPAIIGDVPATRGLPAERVSSHDIVALSDAILAQLAQPADVQAERSVRDRAWLLARFDWSAVASGYGQLLERLAARGA